VFGRWLSHTLEYLFYYLSGLFDCVFEQLEIVSYPSRLHNRQIRLRCPKLRSRQAASEREGTRHWTLNNQMAPSAKAAPLPPWGSAVAGATGAVLANAMVYPLDMSVALPRSTVPTAPANRSFIESRHDYKYRSNTSQPTRSR
jgi:hypothetical protein